MQSRINSHSIESGEFIVLIPFVKKYKSQTHQSNQTPSPSKRPNNGSASNFADSAWSDMMQDLSSLREISNDKDQTSFGFGSCRTKLGERIQGESESCNTHSLEGGCQRKIDGDKQEALSDDLILRILQSPGKNILDEQNCERFTQVLELVNCLYDPHSHECMLFREARLREILVALCRENSTSCLCPPWLKSIIKAFAFLNIFYASFQLQCKEITWTLLKEALDQLEKFGLQIDIKDLEHLSILCPKVNY